MKKSGKPDIRDKQQPFSFLRPWAPYIALVFAVFAAYGNVYGNAFLFDDDMFIVNNMLLRQWSTFGHLLTASTMEGAQFGGGLYRPLQNILYFFVYQIAGPSLVAFHLLNVSLHALNACLVFVLGRRLKFNPYAAFFAALVWAVHPLHTEVIAYMSGTADPLCVCFILLGLIVVLPDFTLRKIFISVPFFILALLAKETGIVFPALLVICMYLVNRERLNFKNYLRTWPLWLMTAGYLFWRLTDPHFEASQSYSHLYAQRSPYLKEYIEHISLRIYTALATLPAYLGLLVWPVGLHFGRVFPVFGQFWIPEVLEGFAIFCAAAGQIVWGRARRGLALSWGLLWFGVSLFPNTGIFVFINALFLEHWMYLPSIGLFLGIAETIAARLQNPQVQKLRRPVAGVIVILSLAFGARTFDQNTLWLDPVVFNQNILKYEPDSPRAHGNLGLAYLNKGDTANAIVEFHKAITINDSFVEARNNLAVALIASPDREANIPEAIKNLNRALEIDPYYYRSYEVLAIIYDHTGDRDKAAYCQNKAEEIKKKFLP